MTVLADEFRTVSKDFVKDFSGKKVLVSGGAGFLGSWMCGVLAECGAEVSCVDNLSTGSLQNVAQLKSEGSVVVGDIETVELARRYDFIFHLASRASPEEYSTRPVETLSSNSVGTLRLLKNATINGSLLVFASSSEVYGDASEVPTPETYFGHVNPIGMRSCYDEGKRFGEAACMAFHRQEGTKMRIVRIFNSYGPRIRKDGLYARALPRFIDQALTNRPITIYGDGKQTRSFCYVTDTIRGILKSSTRNGMDGEVFNIGNTQELTIVELAKLIAMLTASKSEIKFMPPMPDDPRRRCPDISKARRLLDWVPRITLREGLEVTINYFRREPLRH